MYTINHEGLTPREGANNEKVGSYELIAQVNTSTMLPGEMVKIRLFITGYGIIKHPKLFVVMPRDLFDEKKLKMYSALKLENELLTFGVQVDQISEVQTVGLGGIKLNNWSNKYNETT